ncbi:hypothetical protein MTO96_021997 [Rhipicephalus appendiculatus]
MKPVSLFLLAVCLLAVQAEDLAGRTFGFGQSHPALQHAHHGHGMSSQAQGHFNHGFHAGHAHQAHGHAHQGQVSNAHQHQVGHGHQHNHQHSADTNSATVPAASNVNTVPVLMCRVVKVPGNTTAPTTPPKSDSGSSGTDHVGSHIANSISHVFGSVVNPVVALLQNATVWLNRTAHGDNSAAAHHHQHQSAVPHSLVIQKKLQVIGHLGHKRNGPAAVPTRPAHVTTAPTTPSSGTCSHRHGPRSYNSFPPDHAPLQQFSVEPRGQTVTTSTTEATTTSLLPVSTDAPSVQVAETTTTPTVATTSAQPSTAVPTVPLATRTSPAVTTASDTPAPVPVSTTTVPATSLSTTSAPTSTQVARFPFLGFRAVRPKTR